LPPSGRKSTYPTVQIPQATSIIEYEVHRKIVKTGASYDNRFISVVTIENRKTVRWRDYMDSLAAMTALSALRRRQSEGDGYGGVLGGGCSIATSE
jgi:hypothetical protein